MSVYLGKKRQHTTAQITATHGTVLQVIRRVEGLGHKIFMDNYFTLSAVFGDLFQWKINACGTVCHDKHGIPWDNGPKSLKMKKGGHSDMSQGNPKGCSLERQAGCVHSDKHARSPCWRKFHQRIWPGYQTSCCRRLQCIHGVCRQVRQNGQLLWNRPQNMEVDQETVFSPNRHDHYKCISYTQVMWRQDDTQKFPWNSCSRIDNPFTRRKCDS